MIEHGHAFGLTFEENDVNQPPTDVYIPGWIFREWHRSLYVQRLDLLIFYNNLTNVQTILYQGQII